MDSTSSDSEIIHRKRLPQTKRQRYESDESVSSESFDRSSVIEGDFEPLFDEIFGHGDEYKYIYDRGRSEADFDEKTDAMPQKVDALECYNYITKIIQGYKTLFKDFSIDILKLLLDGYSVEYCSFHLNKMSVKELYFVADLIEEYTAFVNARKSSIQKSREVDCLRAFNSFSIDESSIKGMAGFLSINEYSDNLIAFERKYVPRSHIELPFSIANSNADFQGDGWADEQSTAKETSFNKTLVSLSDCDKENVRKHFKKIINQVSSNSTFIDRVNRCYEAQILDGQHYDRNSVNSLEFLQRLYTTDSNDVYNEIRRYVISVAFDSIHVNTDAIKTRYLHSGILEGEYGLSELVDLIISLRGRTESFAGIFYDQNHFFVVKIDQFGVIMSTGVFKEHQTAELRNFLLGVGNICITSTSPNVRFFIQHAQLNLLYVPRCLSYFKDTKELSVPYNIALLVQNPVLYFSKALYSLRNGLPLENFKWDNIEMIEKAIKIACAVHKLDWHNTILHKFGYTLFNILEINLSERYFDYEHLQTLDNLKEIFNSIKFANVCTWFNLKSSKNPLDRTFVHPNFYSLAVIVCKGAYHKLVLSNSDQIQGKDKYDINKDFNDIAELIISRPSLIKAMVFASNLEDTDDTHSLDVVRKILLRDNEIYFTGATDMQIFNDVVPHLENKLYSGTVSKVGTDFYLILVNNATVYVKKTCECSVNQIVDVEISGFTPSQLSYTGMIVENTQKPVNKYKTHNLFRNLNGSSIEEYMRNKLFSILVRPSSSENHCVVVCKIQDDLFYSFKLRECYERGSSVRIFYEYRDRHYDSIDVFIETFVKKMYLRIEEIMKFKYFFRTSEEARAYSNSQGEYTRYSLYFSREFLGYIEFLVANRKILVKIDGDWLLVKNKRFSNLCDLVNYIKVNYSTII